MHAVVVKVTVQDPEPALEHLRSNVVPQVSQAPGFINGYWTRGEGNDGLSMILFESEDAAQAASGKIEEPPGGEVTVDSVEVREVVANA
jgi:heme-degrading monooxygenase HmoA